MFAHEVTCRKQIAKTFQVQRDHTDRLYTKSNKVRRITVYEVTEHARRSLPVASHCTRHLHAEYRGTMSSHHRQHYTVRN